MKKIKILTLVFFLSGYGTLVHAQNAISTAGSDASGTGGTASYTIGQIAYGTAGGTGGKMNEGVQQSFDISTFSGNPIRDKISLESSVYPNPVSESLTLKIVQDKPESLNYQLFDINGKLLKTQNIESNETKINMQHYPSAEYFLKVFNSSSEIVTFKIIKK